jgi:hypothetical protein
VHDPVVSLVTAARGADARWVATAGELRVDAFELGDGDYAAIRDEAATAARRLLTAVT